MISGGLWWGGPLDSFQNTRLLILQEKVALQGAGQW